MTDDEKALRLAVAAHPDEDDPRLRLRDLWDEAGDPRGEFARVQEEIATPAGLSRLQVYAREKRRDALLAAHERAFRCVPCDVCGGLGHVDGMQRSGEWCPECVGGLTVTVGDGPPLSPKTFRHAVTWERGHVVAVRCELGEVMEQETVEKGLPAEVSWWRPTAWALAVVRWHPVVRFEVTDREPEQMHGGWGWWDDGIDTGPASIPRALLAEPSWNSDLALIHGQRETALSVLHRRLAEFVRTWAQVPPPSVR